MLDTKPCGLWLLKTIEAGIKGIKDINSDSVSESMETWNHWNHWNQSTIFRNKRKHRIKL